MPNAVAASKSKPYSVPISESVVFKFAVASTIALLLFNLCWSSLYPDDVRVRSHHFLSQHPEGGVMHRVLYFVFDQSGMIHEDMPSVPERVNTFMEDIRKAHQMEPLQINKRVRAATQANTIIHVRADAPLPEPRNKKR